MKNANQTKIYLIDDEPALLELYSDVVRLVGLPVQSFPRASQFFELVTNFEQDSILVLDLQMPEIDGIEVMRRIAPLTNPPALVLVSGEDSGVLLAAEKLGKAHNLQILTTLTKPVRLARFQQILEQYAMGVSTMPQPAQPSPDQINLTAEELKLAISENQLVLNYQPQIEITTGEMTGVEALVRWNHPVHGLLYPNHIIPLAEKNQLVGAVTEWVIVTATRQVRNWQNENLAISVSINVSPNDITNLVLPEKLAELMDGSKLDPTQITLEVTEGTLMVEPVISLDILTRLRLKGIGLSIDDFGTGYSSLSQLHRVPFTEMKIDRSFVANINEDEIARSIVKTCIILGHELQMQVVAEGVETVAQLDTLRNLGCDIAQGFLVSKAVLPSEIYPYLKRKDNLVRLS